MAVDDHPLDEFLRQGADPMSGRIMKLAMGSLILALTAAGASTGREARSAENMENVSYTATQGNTCYKHKQIFLTSIALNKSLGYTFPNSLTPASVNVTFNSSNNLATVPSVPWVVQNLKVSTTGLKLFLVLVAAHPNGTDNPPNAQANGTGTIVITVTDPNCGNAATTTASIPVEPTDPSNPTT